MEKNKDTIIQTIIVSKLLLSDELNIAIVGDYKIEKSPDIEINISDDLIKNYQIKLESISKENTEYGKLLTKTTEEMIGNLENKIGTKYFNYKANSKNKKIHYWFGIDVNLSAVLFIHKLVKTRELTEEEKRMVESGKYVRIEIDFNE